MCLVRRLTIRSHGQFRLLDGQNRVLEKVDEVRDIVRRDPLDVGSTAEIDSAHGSGPLEKGALKRRRLVWTPWSLGSNWAALGVSGSLIPTEYGRYWDYSIAMQLCMPAAQSYLPYAFLMSVSVRTYPRSPYRFRFLRGGNIGIARLLEEDHPFIVACGDGDVEAVRTMLRTGEGRADDIVARNWHPLAVRESRKCCLSYVLTSH